MQSRPTKKSTAKSNFDVATKTVFPAAASEAMPPVRTAVRRQSTVTRAPRSRARLLPVTTRRRLVAKPRTPHLHCAARAVLQAANPQCRGSRGTPLAFLWGIKRGYSLRKENTPLCLAAAQRAALSMQRQQALPSPPPRKGESKGIPFSGRKKRAVHRTTLIFCSISQCG